MLFLSVDNLPTYYMSLFKAPVGIIEQLDKIRRRFLWGGSELKKKIHLVEWSIVIAPKSEGGLGVGSLFAQNITLLIKWWWRIMNDKGSLWKSVIVSIHNLYNKPASYIARKTSNGVWCNISKAVRALDSLHMDCKDIFSLTPVRMSTSYSGKILGAVTFHFISNSLTYIQSKQLKTVYWEIEFLAMAFHGCGDLNQLVQKN